jgi:F0F1-type ATP synthase assembly protein I
MTKRRPDSQDDEQGEKERLPLNWVRMYALVLEFLAYLAIFGYAGWRLDERRGWQPWGLLSGLIVGMTIGLYRLIREGQRLRLL